MIIFLRKDNINIKFRSKAACPRMANCYLLSKNRNVIRKREHGTGNTSHVPDIFLVQSKI